MKKLRKKMSKEKDTVCIFYKKTGSCSRGDSCSKTHTEAPIARTIVLHHIFPDPDVFSNMLASDTFKLDSLKKQRLVDVFFIDVACMLMQFGELDDMAIAGNKNDTLSGNVIAFYRDSNAAAAAQKALDGTYYAGRRIHVTLSPTLRISTAFCHNFETNQCQMGDACCFIHPLEPTSVTYNEIFPHNVKNIARQLRNPKKKRIIDHPMDLLYGKSKYDPFP